MVHPDAMAVVHHAAAISLRGVFSHHILIRPLKEFWIGAQRGFVKQPIARTVVIGIGYFVDPRILEELTPSVGVHTRPLYVGDEAILDLNFSSRKMARVIRRAGDDTVGLWRRRAWVPFPLERRILDNRIRKAPGCLI